MEDGQRTPKEPQDNDSKFLALGLRYSTMAFEFVGFIGIFGYLGYKADESFGWSPWGLLAGLLTGMAMGLFTLIRQLEKVNR